MANADAKASYLIFGATGGIGSALSLRLAGSGAKLVLAARGGDNLERVIGVDGGLAAVRSH